MIDYIRDGQEIYRERISVDEALARIEAFYKPYHRALRRLINKTYQAFGTVIMVDCHSMPSIGVSRDEPRRPDVVIGDRYGTSCASVLADTVEEKEAVPANQAVDAYDSDSLGVRFSCLAADWGL